MYYNNYKSYVQCKRTKKEVTENADANIEDSVRYRAEWVGKLFQLANFCYNLQAKSVGESIPSMKRLEQFRYKLYHCGRR